ncbi:hypothetical protein C346_02545 [Cryptococcus neoformans D17-1]|nr:hypothetical protein C346_02545 [Cryptococcus neoformans var. grubii D17-1]
MRLRAEHQRTSPPLNFRHLPSSHFRGLSHSSYFGPQWMLP